LSLIVADAGGLGIPSDPHRLKSVVLRNSSSTH
jgi:hypothetical protein